MSYVHYAEAKGEGAVAVLRAFLETLPAQPGFLGADLLLSPPQPGLALVASRWAHEPSLALPESVRGWWFVVAESR